MKLTIQRFAQLMFEEDKREDKAWGFHEFAGYTSFDNMPKCDQILYEKEASAYLNGYSKSGLPECVVRRLTEEELKDLKKRKLL